MATKLMKCAKCDFEALGGPKTLSDHYKQHPDHRSEKLRLKHQLHGEPKSWHGKPRKKQRRRKQQRVSEDVVPAPRPTSRILNFCPNCGFDLRRDS